MYKSRLEEMTTNIVAMDLIIPNRSKPSSASFPTEPGKVRQWIGQLYPVTSANSTRVLIRGLKHCNRLENPVEQRAEVLDSFRPVVRELIDFAVSHYAGQNLPLNSRERNSFSTVTTLLQEMAFGYKIIVSDTLTKANSNSVNNRNLAVLWAMDALDELALRYLQIYQEIPDDVWQDINSLYKIAEDLQIERQNTQKLKPSGINANSIQAIFIRAHMLAISGTASLRRGQTLQLYHFLTKHSDSIQLLNPNQTKINGKNIVGIDLACNAAASNYTFMDPRVSKGFRVLLMDTYLKTIDTEIRNTPNSVSALYESDVLTQQSLIRLQKNHSAQKRRDSRQYFHQSIEFIHGLKEIYATFCYKEPALEEQSSSESPELKLNIQHIDTKNTSDDNLESAQPQRGEWFLQNLSKGGLGLIWKGNNSPQLTVGEIVACKLNLKTQPNDWLIGVSCWEKVAGGETLFAGITHIAKHASPALIERTKGSHNSITTQTECLFAKLFDDVDQDCVITPAYMFHPGETLIVRENKAIRRFQLLEKVGSTGSFSLFTTQAIEATAVN